MQNVIQLSCQSHQGYFIEMLDIGKSTQIGNRTLCQICFEQAVQKNDIIFMKLFQEKLNNQKDLEHEQIEKQKQEYQTKLQPIFKCITEAQANCTEIFKFVEKEFLSLQQTLSSILNNTQTKLNNLGQCPTLTQLQQLAEKIGKGEKLIPLDFSEIHEKIVSEGLQNNLKKMIGQLQEKFKEIRSVFSYLDNKKVNDYKQHIQISTQQQCQALGVNCYDSILATSQDKDICIWKLDNNQFDKIEYLKGHLQKVTCIQFSQQQNWFVSGSEDQTLKIWKINQNFWCCTQTLDGHQNYISDIKISRDENTILSSSFDFKIKVWQYKNQKGWFCFQTLEDHKNYVYFLSINVSNTLFASSSGDFRLKFWQIKNRKWENFITVKKNKDEWIKRICFLNENSMACQVVGSPKIVIIQIIGNIEATQMQEIQLDENDDEFSYNPMIYFKKKKLIILKNKQKIILLRENNNGLYQQISCIHGYYQSPCVISSGLSLIMFEKEKKEIQLFKAS